MGKNKSLLDDDDEEPVVTPKRKKARTADSPQLVESVPIDLKASSIQSEMSYERSTGNAVESAAPTQADVLPVALIGISIKHFMACSETIEIRLDPFTVLVGRNDVGKSTILKAISALLGNSTLDPDSLCRFADSTKVEIRGWFTPGNVPISIDGGNLTTFGEEGLLDDEQRFQIKKIWDVSETKSKPEVYVFGPFFGSDLLTMTEANLQQRCKDFGIKTSKANGDEFNNAEKRRKLADYYIEKSEPPVFDWIQLQTTGSTRKRTVWDGIEAVLPRFEYFKADSSLDGTDSAIQSYIRKQVDDALSGCDLADIEKAIRNRLDFVLGSLTDKINRTIQKDEQVKHSTEFDWSKIVKTTFRSAGDDIDIPLSQRGDGFRRITMMSFFEHLAETRIESHSSIVFAFEEPETFLHPKAQEQLFETIQGLSESKYQVVLCTHSPVLVAHAPQQSLVHVVRDGRKLTVKQDGLEYREIAEDLGISMQNQFLKTFDKAKVLLLVEGIRDAEALQHVSQVYKESSLISATFTDLDIAIVPIGGCDSIKHWIALDLLTTLQKPSFVWMDSDRTFDGDTSKPEQTLLGANLVSETDFMVSSKRCIENYMPCSFLNRQVGVSHLTYGDFDQVKDLWRNHTADPHLVVALGGKKGPASKYFCRMTLTDIQEGFRMKDGTDEFLSLYEAVKKKLPTNLP